MIHKNWVARLILNLLGGNAPMACLPTAIKSQKKKKKTASFGFGAFVT